MEFHTTLIHQLQTEKAVRMAEGGRYFFKVNRKSSKHGIKLAVEKLYGVKVASVNTITVKGKTKNYGGRPSKRPDWKKAIVLVKEGSIDYTTFKD